MGTLSAFWPGREAVKETGAGREASNNLVAGCERDWLCIVVGVAVQRSMRDLET